MIVDVGFTENAIVVKYLKKNEAEEARRIIQGLVVSAKQNVDLSKVDAADLKTKVENIGQAKGVEGI